jgi:hypothetical protein
MHIIPKASKVKVTFYKGITIPDILIAIAALAVVAVTLSSNFAFRVYIAVAVVCLVAPLYVSVGEQRLYVQIAYLFRYVFSKKRFGPDKKAPVSSVIPYREAKNSIVYCKDGSVFGAIEVEPVNFGVLDEAKQDDLIESVYARVRTPSGRTRSGRSSKPRCRSSSTPRWRPSSKGPTGSRRWKALVSSTARNTPSGATSSKAALARSMRSIRRARSTPVSSSPSTASTQMTFQTSWRRRWTRSAPGA